MIQITDYWSIFSHLLSFSWISYIVVANQFVCYNSLTVPVCIQWQTKCMSFCVILFLDYFFQVRSVQLIACCYMQVMTLMSANSFAYCYMQIIMLVSQMFIYASSLFCL